MIADDSDGDPTNAVGHPGDGDEEGGVFSPDARIDGAIDDEVEGNIVAEADEKHGGGEDDEDRVGETTQVHGSEKALLEASARGGRSIGGSARGGRGIGGRDGSGV